MIDYGTHKIYKKTISKQKKVMLGQIPTPKKRKRQKVQKGEIIIPIMIPAQLG